LEKRSEIFECHLCFWRFYIFSNLHKSQSLVKNPIVTKSGFNQKYTHYYEWIFCRNFTYKTSLMIITSIETLMPTMSPRSTSNNITDRNVAIHEIYNQSIVYKKGFYGRYIDDSQHRVLTQTKSFWSLQFVET